MNDYAVRIHLNTTKYYDDPVEKERCRKQLIDFCLNSPEQCLAIGWNHTHYGNEFHSYSEFFHATVKNEKKRKPGWRVKSVLYLFRDAQADDLFWTTDLDGDYWICRAKEGAKPYFDEEKNIGAIIPVEAYSAGQDVAGEIKSLCIGIAQKIYPLESVLEYSKSVFNKLSGKSYYGIEHSESDILANLQAFDLEALAILYLQIKYNYCALPSFSVAEELAAPEMECELISRSIEDKRKAVVHVKAGNDARLDALSYKDYAKDGYTVYLYAPCVENADKAENVVAITDESLRSFYNEYKEILPLSITRWESPGAK